MTLSGPFVIRQLFPGAPPAQVASPSLKGTAPVRAVQHCEPFALASGHGWHSYLPFDLILQWDGTTSSWLSPEAGGWVPLGNIHYPIAEDEGATGLREVRLPHMLTGLPEPGLVQIWTGLIARTPSDWLLAVRPPTNFPRSPMYDSFEGIIDTSWWFGPLIQTIRLKKTDTPIVLSSKTPFMSLVPVHRSSLQDSLRRKVTLETGADGMSEGDWTDFAEALALHGQGGRPGGYKRASSLHLQRHPPDDI